MLLNFDVTTPIDTETSFSLVENNSKLFYEMLRRLERNLVGSCLDKMKSHVSCQDWRGMEQGANSLKGASSYVGAGRIYYACYYIQNAYQMSDFQSMVNYYPLLVEEIIEFKKYSRKMLAEVG